MTTSRTTAAWLCGFWILNVAAVVCFKESGTRMIFWHRAAFFLAGSAGGLASTWCQMKVFTRLNVNLALLVITCGSFFLVQLAFWALYRSPLNALQWLGIGIVFVGLTLACAGPVVERQPDPAPQPEEVQA